MKTQEEIEKAGKHQIGDIHPNGLWVWSRSAKSGKEDWRVIKKTGGKAAAATPAPAAKKEEKEENKPAPAPAASAAAPAAAAKQPAKYDAPTPKVQYKTVKPADGVDIRVPETWKRPHPTKKGEMLIEHRSAYRAHYADKSKKSDDEVIKMVNRPQGNAFIRQIAYEEALARGIPESKLNPAGTLQEWWDAEEFKRDMFSPKVEEKVDDEDVQPYDDSVLGDFDVEKFLNDNFDGGDDQGWADPDNVTIRKTFDNLRNASARRKYDAFVDYVKRRDPMYEKPSEVIDSLGRTYGNFLTSSGGSPILIAAGGAGAGKTYKLKQVMSKLGMVRFDPNDPNHTQEGSTAYHYYIAPRDIEDDKDFMALLHRHNGKVIVFDDKDKLLMSDANKIISTMKAIADSDPEMRVFEGPGGKEELFTGKIIFLTNKESDTLNKNEDRKAIMSRSRFENIHFTVAENLEILKSRYKTIGKKLEHVSSPQEEAKIREQLWQIVKHNKNKLDPKTFTVRKFEKMLETVDKVLQTNKDIEENDDMKETYGSKIQDWRKEALKELMKANDFSEDLSKALSPRVKKDIEELEPAQLKLYRKKFKEDKNGWIDAFGKEFVLAILNSDDDGDDEEEDVETDEEVKKSFLDEISEMSLSEAESILFDD